MPTDPLLEVARLAGVLVIEAPEGNRTTTYVRRDLVRQLEVALIAAGYNIPAARQSYRDKLKAEGRIASEMRDQKVLATLPIGRKVQLTGNMQTFPPGVARYDWGEVAERKRKQVKVRWTSQAEPAWISIYDLEPRW